MLRFAVLSAIVAIASSRPGIVSTSYGGGHGSDEGLSVVSLGGGDHGLGDGGFGAEGVSLDLGGGGGGGADWASGGGVSAVGGSGGGSAGGDFHHGVSIVGGGGGGQGQIIDLTKQGYGHHGPFGGSFVASSKYSSGGHGGGSDGGHYAVSDGGFEGHYSDVLGAGDDGSSGYEHLSSGSFGH